MYAPEALVSSGDWGSKHRQQSAGYMQSSQGTTGSSTGGGSIADVYQVAFPTKEGGTTFAATAMGGPQPAPGPGASADSNQEHVQYQIDSLGAGRCWMGSFCSLACRHVSWEVCAPLSCIASAVLLSYLSCK